MRRKMVNAADVERRGLCTECGTCQGLCPFNNVRLEQDASWQYRVRISDPGKCVKCPRICLQVCPGYQVDVDALNRQVFSDLPEDYVMGNYLSCYVGGSVDADLEERATSGGITSALIAYAIASGRAAGAYVVRDVPGQPFSPSIELARNRDQVRAAAGAKYWPAPLGICLGDILRSKTRVVFVGLPCQITAMRKAQAVYPALRDKIAFSIGLMCGRRATIQGHVFTLERLGIPLREVVAMRYREAPYPGHLAVYLRDGHVVPVPRNKQLSGFAGHLFLHPRCLLCHDGLSELADVSVGDAMGIQVERSRIENNVVVARTEKGAAVLEAAVNEGTIQLSRIAARALLESKRRFLGEKRYSLWARLELAQWIPGLSAPDIRMSRPAQIKSAWEDYARGLFTLGAVRAVQQKYVRSFLRRLPDQVLERYTTYGRAAERVTLSVT